MRVALDFEVNGKRKRGQPKLPESKWKKRHKRLV